MNKDQSTFKSALKKILGVSREEVEAEDKHQREAKAKIKAKPDQPHQGK